MRRRLRTWVYETGKRWQDEATPMERAAAYSGVRATLRLIWHRWTGKVDRNS